MLMPTGKYAGRPLDELPTKFLLWFVSQDAIRWARWPVVLAALDVIAARCRDMGALRAELQLHEPPQKYWKTATRAAARKAEKAAKLRVLEARRALRSSRRVEALQRWYAAETPEERAAVIDAYPDAQLHLLREVHHPQHGTHDSYSTIKKHPRGKLWEA